MGKKSAPAPDYRGAAIEQGEANKDAALQTATLSNPNINTHLGSQTVDWSSGEGSLKTGADGLPYWDSTGERQATVNQTLSPTEQAKYDKGAALDLGLLDTAQSGLNRVDDMMGTRFDMSDLQGVQSVQGPASGVSGPSTYGLQELTGINMPQMNYTGGGGEATHTMPDGSVMRGAGMTGLIGSVASQIPGTRAYDMNQQLETIKANNGMTFNQNGQGQNMSGFGDMRARLPWEQPAQGGKYQKGDDPLQRTNPNEIQRMDTGNLGQSGDLNLDGLSEATGIDLSGLTQNGQLTQQGLQQVQALTQAGGPLQGVDLSQLGAQGNLNSQGLQNIDGVSADGLDPYSTQAGVGGLQQVTDAIRSRGDVDFADKRQALDNDLRIRGFTPGSEGFRREMQGLERQQNDFNQQAILSGGQEQSRIAGMENARRQQGMSEQGQVFSSQMGQRNQQMNERGQVAQFAQQLRAQGLNEQQVQAQLANSNRAQEFGERNTINQSQEQRNASQFGQQESMAQFAQQLRAQGLSEQQIQAQVSGQQRDRQMAERGQVAQFQEGQRASRLNEQGAQQTADQSYADQGFDQQERIAQLQQSMRAQGMSEQAITAQINAANRAQQFGERTTQAGFDQSESQRTFGNQQDLQAAQGAERQRQIQEQAYLRQLPLNEINALRSGSQVNAPQFQQYTGAEVAAAPLFQSAQQQGNYQIQNAQNQPDIAGGLFQLGGAAMTGGTGGFATSALGELFN